MVNDVVKRYKTLLVDLPTDQGGYNHLYWFAVEPTLGRARAAIMRAGLDEDWITLASWPPADLDALPWRPDPALPEVHHAKS